MRSRPKRKDARFIDDTAVAVLDYIRQFDQDAYCYVANTHLDRLMSTISYITTNFPTSSKVLDIGSHPFFIPGYLSLKGFENVYTADIDRPGDFPLDPQWKISPVKLDIEEDRLPYENETFDLILLLEVFEHLYKRPNHVFREIRRTLKPNGVLIISTPNGGGIGKYYKCLIKGEFGHPIYECSAVYEKLRHFSHIREYSVSELKTYLKHFEFTIDDIILDTFYETRIENDGRIIRRRGGGIKRLIRKAFGFLPTFQNNIFLVAKKSS